MMGSPRVPHHLLALWPDSQGGGLCVDVSRPCWTVQFTLLPAWT